MLLFMFRTFFRIVSFGSGVFALPFSCVRRGRGVGACQFHGHGAATLSGPFMQG